MPQTAYLRVKWSSEIRRISEIHLNLIAIEPFNEPITIPIIEGKVNLPDPKKAYSKLNEEEKKLCRKLSENFLANFLSQTEDHSSWVSLVLILGKECHREIEFPPGASEKVISNVSSFISNFFSEIEAERKHIFTRMAENRLFWQSVDDIIVFDNAEIINKANRAISNKSSLQQIKYLSALKKILIDAEKAYGKDSYLRIDFEHFKEGLFPRDPFTHRESLFSWIEESYFKATLEIEFLSKTQIKILKKEVERVSKMVKAIDHDWNIYRWCVSGDGHDSIASMGYNPSSLVERFDRMILSKSRIKKRAEKVMLDFKMRENLNQGSSAAAIIRYLVYGIRGFNPEYSHPQDLMNLRVWISALFYDIQGFSHDDIRKALERKRHLYRLTTRP